MFIKNMVFCVFNPFNILKDRLFKGKYYFINNKGNILWSTDESVNNVITSNFNHYLYWKNG